MNKENETSQYYIVNESGLYCRGTRYGGEKDWTNEKSLGSKGAFRYSLKGAWKNIRKHPRKFDGCKIVKIEDL